VDQVDRMYRGHLLESETYIGGKVEAIESGVFRADLPCKFKVQADAYQGLIDRYGLLDKHVLIL
jgi:DNA polymerase epsilon subunit 1